MVRKAGVHIIPAGFEYDRIVIPMLREYPVLKAYVLQDNATSHGYPREKELADYYVKKLEALPFEIEKVEIDLYDFDEVFEATCTIIRREQKAGNPVYINISSAPKLISVAMMFAAFLCRDDGGLELFYVRPRKYYTAELVELAESFGEPEVDREELVHKVEELSREISQHGLASEDAEIIELPPFPVQSLHDVEYEIMQALSELGKVESIKDLVEIVNRKEQGSKVSRSLVQYYIGRLEKFGLIKTERLKKQLTIMPTRLGILYGKTKLYRI